MIVIVWLCSSDLAPGVNGQISPGYVYINKTQYFEGVPKEVWEFHVGGYQVCEKWLKYRRGRQLSFDDSHALPESDCGPEGDNSTDGGDR